MLDEPKFFANSDRLPPQNLEAEESILGGILLDPEAISRVVDLLRPEIFSIKSHQEIYRATLTLHNQGKATDLMTVTTWLADHNLLDKVGGTPKIAQLVDRTVSAVNIDQYAKLILDKHIRRKLITSGHEIIELGYQTGTDLETILDQAEQRVFSITQERPQQGLVPISETLIHAFQDIENLNQGTALPGIPCNFYDLDAMTGGFQRSDLIVVAGRPSMGKTSFALNIAHNIAAGQGLAVAVFSLEMSKEQLVQRLLSSEAKIESNRLRSGRLSQMEWEPLSHALGLLSELPLFIDDTANITVTQMRSQTRRLQAEQGKGLGLILIDYLQLMEGGGDNRVQELSKITRQLKGLARELGVPIIALSQLSRSVESRTNKRPMMSDLRESGCLAGDSLVTLADSGLEVPIQELVGKSGFSVWGLNEKNMRLETASVSHAFSTGIKPVFTLKTKLGRQIRATANHKFLTLQGWKRLDELSFNEYLCLPSNLPIADAKIRFPRQRILSSVASSFDKANLRREPGLTVAEITQTKELLALSNREVDWDEIVAIIPDGEVEVFDLTVPGLHNFIANNIIVHNSIEQDADLVIMLYRDEYYNPDTVDRGIAEVIITKHRNGPVGTVKLLFDPQFTNFRNLANPKR